MGLGLIGLLIVGALAGRLATTVLKKEGHGISANLAIGIVGAMILLWLIDFLKARR